MHSRFFWTDGKEKILMDGREKKKAKENKYSKIWLKREKRKGKETQKGNNLT